MKTRCFDHIDLRVKNMEVAIKFYGQFLPQLGFVREQTYCRTGAASRRKKSGRAGNLCRVQPGLLRVLLRGP